MKFSIKDFFSECEQILNGKLQCLCSDCPTVYPLHVNPRLNISSVNMNKSADNPGFVIQFVLIVLTLKHQITSFFTAHLSLTKERRSFKKLKDYFKQN